MVVNRILPPLPEFPGLPPGVRRGVERSVRALAASIWASPVPCVACLDPANRLYLRSFPTGRLRPKLDGHILVRSLEGVIVGHYDAAGRHHLFGAVPACERCLDRMRRDDAGELYEDDGDEIIDDPVPLCIEGAILQLYSHNGGAMAVAMAT